MTGKIFTAALALLVAFGCSDPPTTATDQVDAAPITFGRGNTNGAVLYLPLDACGVIDGNGNWFSPVSCSMALATPSENRNATVVVHASGVPNPTGQTVHWGPDNPGPGIAAIWAFLYGIEGPPYPCGLYDSEGADVHTVNWHATVTPNGHGSIVCHFSEKWAFELPS